MIRVESCEVRVTSCKAALGHARETKEELQRALVVKGRELGEAREELTRQHDELTRQLWQKEEELHQGQKELRDSLTAAHKEHTEQLAAQAVASQQALAAEVAELVACSLQPETCSV